MMSHELDKELFTEAHWDEVQAFDYGDESWEVEVSKWLKGSRGTVSAIEEMNDSDNPTTIWLYRLKNGTMVGFGALSKSAWSWTQKKDPWIPVTLITWCGIRKDLQGQPPEADGRRYSHQIMDDLINEATSTHVTHPVLGLLVDTRNSRAMHLYSRFKFRSDLATWMDRDTGVTYQKMGVVLNQESFRRLHGTWERPKRK